MSETNKGFITNYESAVPIHQRIMVEQLLEEKRRQGLLLSNEDVKTELSTRIEQIKARGQAFRYTPVAPGVTISSDFFNKAFEDIRIDLEVLYAQIAIVASDRSRISAVTQDQFIKTKAAILKLVNDLRLFQFLRDNPEYQDAKYIDFHIAKNETFIKPRAEVDIRTRTLKIPPKIGNVLSRGRFNLDRVTIDTVLHGGGIVSRSLREFSKDNIIDSNPETFWAELVLNDDIPEHLYLLSHSSPARLLGSGTQRGNRYDSHGVIFDVILKFSRTISTNNLKILPIADYPIKLIDLAYKTTDLSEIWTPFHNFDPTNYPDTLDWMEWNGPRTRLVSIKATLEQANFSSNIYHIPSDLLYNNQLWEQILTKTYDNTLHNIELNEILVDKIAAEPEILAYLNELHDYASELSKATLEPGSINEYRLIERVVGTTSKLLGKTTPNDNSDLITTLDGVPIQTQSPLVEIKKNQYICGLRSIEVNDINYEPFAFYESPKFNSNANILEVSIETNEEHRFSEDELIADKFQRTSIEYELQLSDEIAFPIAPINNKITDNDSDGLLINDELLIISRSTRGAITRFPYFDNAAESASIQVRKNGIRLSPTIPNSSSANVSLQYNYTVSMVTVDTYKYINIVFNSKTYDPRAVYTATYVAHIDAGIINIDDRLNSRPVEPPEQHISTDRNNRLSLDFYPYVEYTIINDTGAWTQEDEDIAKWRFSPGDINYTQGVVGIASTGQVTVVSGTNTLWLNHHVDLIVTGQVAGVSGASIMFQGDTTAYPIHKIQNNSGLTTISTIDTGFLQNRPTTDLKYIIGKTVTVDGIVWGLNNTYYEPVQVFVNDIKATNRTDYKKLEHNAFLSQTTTNKIYEFIQAGKFIYFNAPVNGRIEVVYRYLSKFIKINALLRSNKIVNNADTPILNDYKIRIKNSKI